MEKQLKILQSFAISAVVVIIFVVAATVVAELSHPFKDFLKENFIHHWVGKGVISATIFFAVGFLAMVYPLKSNSRSAALWLTILSLTAIIGFFAILVFYFYATYWA